MIQSYIFKMSCDSEDVCDSSSTEMLDSERSCRSPSSFKMFTDSEDEEDILYRVCVTVFPQIYYKHVNRCEALRKFYNLMDNGLLVVFSYKNV